MTSEPSVQKLSMSTSYYILHNFKNTNENRFRLFVNFRIPSLFKFLWKHPMHWHWNSWTFRWYLILKLNSRHVGGAEMSTVSQLSTNYTKLSDSRRNSEVPNAALEMNINRPRYDIQGKAFLISWSWHQFTNSPIPQSTIFCIKIFIVLHIFFSGLKSSTFSKSWGGIKMHFKASLK